jgi:hypothetical protein
MQEWLKIFPLPLLVLTFILVLVPTVAAILIRITLHKHLRDQIVKVSRLLASSGNRGLQPKILENLEARYKEASQNLESVNTVALISSTYGQETILLQGFKLCCDQAENFCRILPNLLLVFGLLGTFWGITINLYEISAAINLIKSADISALIQQLLPQLQGMGIAFFTSLTALFCSSLITLFNFFFNTGWAKYQLIGCLEDYLDNIYKPTVEGDTRLDKAVNRMVEQQQEFLTRFHEKVAQVLETSFGHAAKQIAEECTRVNKLAEQVYTQFAQAAGTIGTAATTFQHSAQSLEKQTQSVAQFVPQFQNSAEQIHLGTVRFLAAAEKIEQTNAIANLDRITADLCTTQQAFTQSTQTLETGLQGIMSSNLEAAQLAEKVYSQLQTSTSQIHNGSTSFLEAATLIQDCTLAEQLNSAADKWILAQQEFTDSTLIFSQSSEAWEPAIASLNASSNTLEDLGTKVHQLSQDSLKVAEASQKTTAAREQQLLANQQSFENIVQNLNRMIGQVESRLHTLNESCSTKAEQRLQAYKEQNVQFLKIMENYVTQFSDLQRSLNQLIDSVTETKVSLRDLGEIWTASSTNQLNAHDLQNEQLLKKIEQHALQVELNQRSLSKLVDTLTKTSVETDQKLFKTACEDLSELDLAAIKSLVSYFEEMPSKIWQYHRDHNALVEEATIISKRYAEAADILRNVRNQKDLQALLKFLGTLKEEVSRYKHESYKYRWSTSLEKEVLVKLKEIVDYKQNQSKFQELS